MKRKTKAELRKMRGFLPVSDYELHYRLRSILAKEGACRYSKLRLEYGIDPIALERQAQAYPTIFYIVEAENGTQPTINLHEGELPSREDFLMLKQLVELLKGAGKNGFFLANLHKRTAFTSQDIQRLLASQAQVEATKIKGKILYRWINETTPKKPVKESLIQDSQPALKPLPEPRPEPVAVQNNQEVGRDLSEVEYDNELKFHPASPGSALRRPTPGRASFFPRDGRVRARHEPPSSITLTNDKEAQPMNIEKARQILLKHVADAFEAGRHLKQLPELSGLSGDTVQAVLRAYPNDFVIEDVKEVSETSAGKPTKYRIVARIVRIAPHLLTATKSVMVNDMSGDYEVPHPYPVLENELEETA